MEEDCDHVLRLDFMRIQSEQVFLRMMPIILACSLIRLSITRIRIVHHSRLEVERSYTIDATNRKVTPRMPG